MFQQKKSTYVENAQQLAFCKVCKNRLFATDETLLCRLTNAVANFETECTTFSLDDESLETTENNVRQNIIKFIHKNYFTFQLKDENYKWLFHKVATPKYKTVQETHGLSFKDINTNQERVGWSFCAIVAVVFGYTWTTESWHILIWLLTLFVAIGFFIYAIFTLFYYKHKTVLRTTAEGLYYHDQLYHWSDINDFCFLDTSQEKEKNIRVIIGTISSGIVAFNLTKIDIAEAELIEILNLNIAQHYTILDKKRGAMIVSE
ncbi:hypothetical protein U8527_16030 [Kordia algicida OT-1]|uniref:Uncharacterized protein n=1 Tax=Kordia algicida OT-1 TaxID=391587 RepID=A9E480_9FLAO|nr:hypothetical protein [Kordia algicida]EDP95330.1 hypothetical protein KAOT1_09666 [Kordia algicida OT-1]